ncbi:MAG: NADH-ubiquinone oxidoreductase-F iron-sulfur binding region domain-containing protein [Chloroflexota bacterium]|nr:NADH-ubiquinone oxidoreductase-F iron-sulfur binding region domain-containing protein [Chloroflexota bacterium]
MYEQMRSEADKIWNARSNSIHPIISVGISASSVSVGAGRTLARIREEVQQKYSDVIVEEVGDIGFSWADPVVHITMPGTPQITYGNISEDIVEQFLADILVDSNLRSDLSLGVAGDGEFKGINPLENQPWMIHQKRIIMENYGYTIPQNLSHYISNGGMEALDKALNSMTPEEVIEEVKNSDLRGRGGALFPTGVKWSFMQNAPEGDKYLAINAEEGDPGAFTDVSIIENDPYKLLEGMLIASYAMGCNKSFIHVRAEYQLAVERLTEAVKSLEEHNLVGDNILGSGFSHEIEVDATGHAYICGEETALMESLEGKRGAPRPRPPFPAGYGIFGRPTNINNVKTISYVPTVIKIGHKEFKNIGAESASGTALLSLSGHINRRGVAEIPVGLNLSTVIDDIGGGSSDSNGIKALQCGGPLGGIMSSEEMDMPTDFQGMSLKGSPLGSGGIMVVSNSSCIVNLVKNIAEFNEDESCGKCFPCRKGTTHIVQILKNIVEGYGNQSDLSKLNDIGESMVAGSLCGLGQLAPGVLKNALKYFSEEFNEHIDEKKCAAGVCGKLA